ncbi:MAG: Ig-like domain-containing protein [Verrucomicrobiota bacterium]
MINTYSKLWALALLGAFTSGASTPTYTTVADTSMTVPGKTNKFSNFGNVAYEGTKVIFEHITYDPYQSTLYFWSGSSSSLLVDKATSVPSGGGGVFTNFSAYSMMFQAGKPTFVGMGAGRTGVYQHNGTSLVRVFDSSTIQPGPGRQFVTFGAPEAEGTKLYFLAVISQNQRGIYSFDNGVLTELLAPGSKFPGSTNDISMSAQLSVEHGAIGFWGVDGTNNVNEGIFILKNGTVATIATRNTTVPGTNRFFTRFSSPPLVAGGKVYFLGFYDTNTHALFSANLDGTGLTTIYDPKNSYAGFTNNFLFPAPLAVDGGKVIFSGYSVGVGQGVLAITGNTLTLLAGPGSLINGKTVSYAQAQTKGYVSGKLAFSAGFKDNTAGVFILNGSGGGTVTDTVKPLLAITAPANGSRLLGSQPTLQVSGTASDNVGVAGVVLAANGSAVSLVSSTNNYRTWSAQMTPAAGTNTVTAYATDAAGNYSRTNTVVFFYSVNGFC